MSADEECSSPSAPAPAIYGRRFWTAYAANLLLVSANALTFRFADFVAKLGGTESDSGLLVGFGVIGAVFFRLFSGGWMDRFGIGRVWLIGAATFVVGGFMMFTATELNWWLYVARLLFATGLATLFSCSMSHIQNEAPPSHRTEVIASLGSSGFLGLMTGTLAADGILALFAERTADTYRALFGVTMACGVIYFLLVAGLTRRDPKPQSTHATPNAWTLFRQYFPGPVIFCGFFMGGGFAVLSTFLTRFAASRGFEGISWYFVSYALSAFTFRIISRTWSRRFGRHILIVVGMTAQSVGFVAIPFVTAEWMLCLPAIAVGFGHALLFPAVVSLGTATYPVRYRGTGTTLILGTFDLGQLILAPVFGAVVDRFGFEPMFYATGGTALVIGFAYGLSALGKTDNDGRSDSPVDDRELVVRVDPQPRPACAGRT